MLTGDKEDQEYMAGERNAWERRRVTSCHCPGTTAAQHLVKPLAKPASGFLLMLC